MISLVDIFNRSTNDKTNNGLQVIRNKKPAIKEINNNNRPYYTTKTTYNSIIPLKIYQTWYTKNLPPKMKERVELLKVDNPQFEHCLFDDNDCREFIKNNFQQDVLYAFDQLVPGAYKADLWRLCVLYKNGGIYMDIKLKCINGFKLIELTENEHYVIDRLPPLSIYNAIMVCKEGNSFLWRGICRIVANVKTKYYGNHCLSVTGPKLLGDIILRNNLKLNTDLIHHFNGGYITYKNCFVISTEYPEYNSERISTYISINPNLKRYDKLWNERRIYK
jgi:mannosyltransferase OCH1-like enzyme